MQNFNEILRQDDNGNEQYDKLRNNLKNKLKRKRISKGKL